MRKPFLLLCLLMTLGLSLAAHAEGLPWIGSDKEALAQARATGRPLLLYLHADYCVWCGVMDRTTFRDSRVLLLASRYVLCKMDGDHEGKSYLQKFKVEKYPFHAVLDSSGTLLAKAPDYMDPDKYAHVLAADLPTDAVARLAADRTAHPGDAQTLALLAVIHAERDEVEDAAQAQAALSALPAPPPPDLATAASHALGLAYSARGEDAQAVPCLQAATAAATDARETIALHFLLATCWTRLHKKADALAELEAIRRFRPATGDEKKDAQKQEKALAASTD